MPRLEIPSTTPIPLLFQQGIGPPKCPQPATCGPTRKSLDLTVVSRVSFNRLLAWEKDERKAHGDRAHGRQQGTLIHPAQRCRRNRLSDRFCWPKTGSLLLSTGRYPRLYPGSDRLLPVANRVREGRNGRAWSVGRPGQGSGRLQEEAQAQARAALR